MMVEDEFGGSRMNDLRTVVWLKMIDSVGAPLWFEVALAMMVLQTSLMTPGKLKTAITVGCS
jgi:hypothetical protein